METGVYKIVLFTSVVGGLTNPVFGCSVNKNYERGGSGRV